MMGGGTPRDPVACDSGFAVGLAVALTQDAAHGNEYIVAKVAMLCAPITQRDDAFVTGAVTTQLVAQGGDAVSGDETASCAPGEALVGIDAHLITTDGLFNSVSIECAALTPSGPRANAETVAVPNTGTTAADAHAGCGDGTVVDQAQGFAGGEVDRLQITCSAPGCS
jgi:hypothetical protein